MGRSELIHYDESRKGKELFFPEGPSKKASAPRSKFFELVGDPSQIIKVGVHNFDANETMNMLERFSLVRNNVRMTKLPNGYFTEKDVVTGSVVPFYPDTTSLYQILETHNVEELLKHYQRDDDPVHNLFLFFDENLDRLEELVDNGLYYTDFNHGNILFSNNESHLIDFDPGYVRTASKENYKAVLDSYDLLLFIALKRFELLDLCTYKSKNFKAMRKRLEKVENKVRRRMH